MKVFTIGFTKEPAEKFFGVLRCAGVQRVVDVRPDNVSQLAGFARRDDLRFFARALCDADSVHLAELVPTRDILDAYEQGKGSWGDYEKRLLALMEKRRIEEIEENVPRTLLDGGFLLFSEDQPHHCHRRLVAESGPAGAVGKRGRGPLDLRWERAA